MRVANHTANNWRFIIGQRFGVDKGGNLYASNTEITGKITANSGKIGGWDIGGSNGNYYLKSEGGSGYSQYRFWLTPGSDSSGYLMRYWYGTNSTAASNAKFSLSKNGQLYATQAHIIGDIQATSLSLDDNAQIPFCNFGEISSLAAGGGSTQIIIAVDHFYSNINNTNLLYGITLKLQSKTGTVHGRLPNSITVYYKFTGIAERDEGIMLSNNTVSGTFTIPTNTFIDSSVFYSGSFPTINFQFDETPDAGTVRINTVTISSSSSGTYNEQYTTSAYSLKASQSIQLSADLIPKNGVSVDLGSQDHPFNNLYVSTGGINESDRRLKQDIVTLSLQYNQFFDKLQPVSYKFIHNTSNRKHLGFISQDIEASLLQCGLTSQQFAGLCKSWDDTIQDYIYGLRYNEFIPLNTWQIQLLKPRVSSLEERCTLLEQRIHELESQLNKI